MRLQTKPVARLSGFEGFFPPKSYFWIKNVAGCCRRAFYIPLKMYLYLRGTFQGRLCESLGCHPFLPSDAVPVHMLWPQSPFSVIYPPLQAPSPLSLPLSSSLTSLQLFFPVYQGFVDVSGCSSQYEQQCLW